MRFNYDDRTKIYNVIESNELQLLVKQYNNVWLVPCSVVVFAHGGICFSGHSKMLFDIPLKQAKIPTHMPNMLGIFPQNTVKNTRVHWKRGQKGKWNCPQSPIHNKGRRKW